MKALRENASGGLGKFILFGLLGLAVAGLALTDVGGFFSGGTGSNNVIKIAGKTVSITDFDKDVRQQTQMLGVSPQEAYKMGYINSVIGGKLREILLEDLADDTGLEASQERVAKHILTLLKPLSQQNGNKPDAILQQILSTQGLSEKQFAQSIAQEMMSSLIEESVNAGSSITSAPLAISLMQYQNEMRDVEYITLADKDAAAPTPSADDIQNFYNASKDKFLIPETRDITIISLNDDDLAENTQLSATDILDKKLERVETLEDLVLSQVDIAEIKQQLPITPYTISGLTESGAYDSNKTKLPATIADNIQTISDESYAIDEGESTMAIELPGAKFIIITINSITPENYPALEDVKQQLTQDWVKSQKTLKNNAKAIEAINQISENSSDLKTYAAANNIKLNSTTLTRNKDSKLFSASAINSLFMAPVNTVGSVKTANGITIYRVAKASTSKPSNQSDDLKQLKKSLRDNAQQELLTHILETEHEKSPAKINTNLLDRVYGEQSQYY